MKISVVTPHGELYNEDIDYVVMNEGEIATLNLLEALNYTFGNKDFNVLSKINGIAFKKNVR